MLKATLRRLRLLAVIVAAVTAALLVSLAVIDLGPALKARAERAGSAFLDRPLHIGRLSIQLGRGQFVLEDLRVDGLTPDARPWLVASRVDVALTWQALIRREVLLARVVMSDWTLLVESFPGGRHNWPRVGGPPRPPRTGPPVVVATVRDFQATRGTFIFEDHAARWNVTAPNLEVTAGKLARYQGRARSHGGVVHFHDFEPMAASISTRFELVDGNIVLDETRLVTDGAVSDVTGVIDPRRFPEMTYQVRSTIQFPRMREIFFAKETFALHGEGEFRGTFHLFKGGRELTGTFDSPEAGLNQYRFQQLRGALHWVPQQFDVTDATAGFYGGQMRFTHRMSELGRPGRRGNARFEVNYRDVDLTRLTDLWQTRGLRVAGFGSGNNVLRWPLGAFRDRTASGHLAVRAPAGVPLMTRDVTSDQQSAALARATRTRPAPLPFTAPVAMAGHVSYRITGNEVTVDSGELATADTLATFRGTTTFSGERTHLPFHVTSASWQESDRLLVGLMNAFGSSARAVAFDAAGEFDGVLTGALRRPRVEGQFRVSALHAFNVLWGDADGAVVVEDSYARVSRALIQRDDGAMNVSGVFSLGFPRRDGGEEINARIRLERRPVADLMTAFNLREYPITGALSGEVHVSGAYTRPLGFGRITLDGGSAYGERFATATAGLRFEGTGVRLDSLTLRKGEGTLSGAAYVGWNGSYSFNVEGRGLAVGDLDLLSSEGLPRLSGRLQLTAGGSGTFAEPRYDVRVDVQQLAAGSELIGEVSARLLIRDQVLTTEMEAASARLAISGAGKVTFDETRSMADLTFRVSDTSLDQYARLFAPALAPGTTAVASGTIRVTGDLSNRNQLRIETAVDALNLRFADYRLHNQGPLEIDIAGPTLTFTAFRLVGDDTALDLGGTVDVRTQALSLQAAGAANLAVLQGLGNDVRSSGRADVSVLIGGTAAQPIVSGRAVLTQGRFRHFSMPHALEDLNGTITFNAAGIRLADNDGGLRGRLGGGTVVFAGRIGFSGYALSDFDVTAEGTDMRLRFPEGMRSLVDASLALRGPVSGPVLSGAVHVDNATWTSGFGSSSGLFANDTGGGVFPAGSGASATTFPLRYDVRIVAPSTLRVENAQAQIVASTELTLGGTFDRPVLLGRADIDRGDVRFEGRRYQVTRGSVDFINPTRLQPFFDIEAETRVRVPGQTYRVTLRLTGTTDRLNPTFQSDPPLAPIDVMTLLFSDAAPAGDIELASLRQPNQREQDLLQARATRALTSVLSEEVSRVVEQTFGVDTFQITPMLIDPAQQTTGLTVNPAARVTIGKRISDRIYLTYARSLSSSRLDEIILLEYDQSDRFGWVLSQNEDRTYALEVRQRHVF